MDDEHSQMSNYFRKRSFSSFTPESSDPVLPDLKPVGTKQFPESESATEMSGNESDSHPAESQNLPAISTPSGEIAEQSTPDIIALPVKSLLRVFEGPEKEMRQPLYDVPRKLNLEAVANNSEGCEQQNQQCQQIVVSRIFIFSGLKPMKDISFPTNNLDQFQWQT